MSRLKELTPKQLSLLPKIKDKWLAIGLSTKPANRKAAEEGAILAYKEVGLEPPRICLWLRSPLEGYLSAYLISKCPASIFEFNQRLLSANQGLSLAKLIATSTQVEQVEQQVRERVRRQVRQQVEQQVRERVRRQVRQQVEQQVIQQVRQQVSQQVEQQVIQQVSQQVEQQVEQQVWQQVEQQVEQQVWQQVEQQVEQQVSAQVWQQVRQQVSAQVWQQVRQQVDQQVWQQVDQQVEQVSAQVWQQVRQQVDQQVFANYPIWGQHEAGWLSFYDYFHQIGIIKTTGMWQVAKNCGWWWAFKNVVILTERPNLLNLDTNGRLHSETGPVIQYPDGFKFYAIHGVIVPEQIIINPKSITISQIKEEKNAEIKRLMRERFGENKYLTETKAKVIDIDNVVTLKNKTGNIMRALMLDDEKRCFLVGSDGSTPRTYYMEVPNTIKTCREAHNFLSGLDETNLVAQS